MRVRGLDRGHAILPPAPRGAGDHGPRRLGEDEIRGIYSDIVRRVARDFLAGVQTNVRMRVFANPLPLLRSTISRAYTRTVRLGELIETQLFARVWADT